MTCRNALSRARQNCLTKLEYNEHDVSTVLQSAADRRGRDRAILSRQRVRKASKGKTMTTPYQQLLTDYHTSGAYQQLLTDTQMLCSMSSKGNCWDNALVESFFATLKRERVHHHRYRTRQEALADIFEYIEVWYNRKRRHRCVARACLITLLRASLTIQ